MCRLGKIYIFFAGSFINIELNLFSDLICICLTIYYILHTCKIYVDSLFLHSFRSEHHLTEVCEKSSSSKHKDGANPVLEGEWVLEVDNGEKQTQELAQCHHHCYCQRGAFRR